MGAFFVTQSITMAEQNTEKELRARVELLEHMVDAKEKSKDELKALIRGTQQERQDLKDRAEAWETAAEESWLACTTCGSPSRRKKALALLDYARSLGKK